MSDDQRRAVVALLGGIAPEVRDALSERFELVAARDLGKLTLAERAGIYRAVTTAMAGAPASSLDALPALRTIVSCGAGMDRFDPKDLARRGIELVAISHLMTEDTAEMAVALVFALLRRILPNDVHVRSGAWAGGRPPSGSRVTGKSAGIVGLGKIGRRVAAKLDGLGLVVRYCGRTPKLDLPYSFVPDPVRLAETSDVLILCCAGGNDTRHLVNAAMLAALGPEGYLVNVARGSVVDEEALLEALGARAIAGAALDVFENEPAPDPRFLTLDNVILQPHAATLTRENRAALVSEVLRLIE